MTVGAFNHTYVTKWNLEIARARAAYYQDPTALSRLEDHRDAVRDSALADVGIRLDQAARERLVADYRMLRQQGFSRQHIADRLGVAYRTLDRTLQRAAHCGLINMEEL